MIKKYIGNLFITTRFYISAGLCALTFIASFFVPVFFPVAKIFFTAFIILIAADYFFLFVISKAPSARREMGDRLSNADENIVTLVVKNNSAYTVNIELIDELPFQFQERGFAITKNFLPRQQQNITYSITPTQRGLYEFGNILLYVQSQLGLVLRRHIAEAAEQAQVYPSFLHQQSYQLLSNATIEGGGNRRIRKIGQSMEFEQIKDYINGDDIRTINWKATARKGSLMVNNYVDEKSQQVYCIIDKGRLMKMPFAGLSLLDYAINTVLTLSNVCLQKQDKIGLISFSNKMGSIIAANRNPIQKENIMQALYKEKTDFLESDFEMLYTQVRHKIKQRSLLILFTNFESVNGLKRQIAYLRSIARHHLLLVVFFENTELNKLSNAEANNIEDVYVKTIASKFVYEKRLLVKELQQYGIASILTSPQQLTINTLNRYLKFKAQQAI
ncbi:MAG: DUF58 domain-containing protein [Bacteroidetes bacterium]|nr:DUF58 domain-containing protein [Bacteroidota bacterium]MBS1757762.1 DUF58 domain-containing protein [Bacteroidota bacterium]